MSYKTAYKDIMRSYEADRDRAAVLLHKRREELYKRVPRLREIEDELSQSGISVAKQLAMTVAVDGLKSAEPLLSKLRRQSRDLKKEKQRLLIENGVPEGYFSDIYHCLLCRDTGYIENSDRIPERCTCLKQRLIERYYDLSNIRGLLETENFDTFDLRHYSESDDPLHGISPQRNMQLIYQNALKFAMDFEIEFQNLLFYGATGLGKTFLCNCIAKDLLDRGYSVLYLTAPKMFEIIEENRFNRDDMEEPSYIIEAVTDVDLLILDDLGAEFSTLVTSAALFNIINQRILAKKATVISTNLDVQELELNYSDRTISRFLGHYKMSKFFGDDIRAVKAMKKY